MFADEIHDMLSSTNRVDKLFQSESYYARRNPSSSYEIENFLLFAKLNSVLCYRFIFLYVNGTGM